MRSSSRIVFGGWFLFSTGLPFDIPSLVSTATEVPKVKLFTKISEFDGFSGVCRLGTGLCLGILVTTMGCMPKAGQNAAMRTPFTDSFDREALGEKYLKSGGTWRIENGALFSSGERNIPLWLDVPLPKNVKVEFTTWSNSPQVDTKIEIFGDGLRHESGYIVILGGWNNRITTIARLDEHEKTRVEKKTRWEKGRKYRWTVQRTDGSGLELWIDGNPILTYADSAALFGPKNNKLGFTNWESEVYYDDLVITPLPD